ncbi:MAG: Menaquinone biosynthesis methyltransferase [uncultured Rubrobacteraceae bacterium]|uniref:Menaquinone biosynthesis methyltransferase n=1 Tax=uncultured Rubrobacteraceae bacterium TaxID=349277 RepID=A0A6J4TM87_9ACTN|nr:MAG: Menaquinone biosynthesis methyltransferase [uncultured Rubrobacteraceae bacterium]
MKTKKRNRRSDGWIARAVSRTALAGTAAVIAYALWWRMNPSACPYGVRFFVELPHPFITRRRLREILAPRPGERVLEVGPGTGYYALHTARWLQPGGTLEVLDLQQGMLDHTLGRARRQGITNIVAARGDAQALPYPDGLFDAAYLTLVLGEVPDQHAALRDLGRVLKPDGRLVVGEVFPDFHMVPFGTLKERAEAEGLTFERRVGGPLGYFALFRALSTLRGRRDMEDGRAPDDTGRTGRVVGAPELGPFRRAKS